VLGARIERRGWKAQELAAIRAMHQIDAAAPLAIDQERLEQELARLNVSSTLCETERTS
jgi:hypothetical protein